MNESVKSRYRPKNPAKYKGNPNNIICRSNWEKKFCQWCDTNESILLWASEEFSIPYRSPLDNRLHKYYPDFLIKVQEGSGVVKDIEDNQIVMGYPAVPLKDFIKKNKN